MGVLCGMPSSCLGHRHHHPHDRCHHRPHQHLPQQLTITSLQHCLHQKTACMIYSSTSDKNFVENITGTKIKQTHMVGNIRSCCGEWREGFVLRRVKQNDTQGQRAPVCKLRMTGVSVWVSSFQTNRKSLQNVSTSSFFPCWLLDIAQVESELK